MVWREEQTSPSIPLSQSLTPSKALGLCDSGRAKRGEEAAEESLKLQRLVHEVEGKNQLRNRKYNMKQQGLGEKLRRVLQKVQLPQQ